MASLGRWQNILSNQCIHKSQHLPSQLGYHQFLSPDQMGQLSIPFSVHGNLMVLQELSLVSITTCRTLNLIEKLRISSMITYWIPYLLNWAYWKLKRDWDCSLIPILAVDLDFQS